MPRTYRRHSAAHMLKYIVCFREQYGRSPSHREIATGCQITSLSQVNFMLKKLERLGKIRLTGERHGIEVLDATWKQPAVSV